MPSSRAGFLACGVVEAVVAGTMKRWWRHGMQGGIVCACLELEMAESLYDAVEGPNGSLVFLVRGLAPCRLGLIA